MPLLLSPAGPGIPRRNLLQRGLLDCARGWRRERDRNV